MGQSVSQTVCERIRENCVSLPVFDRTAQRLHDIVSSKSFDVSAIQELIGTDPSLSASVLRMANSSFYSSLEKTTSVSDAIVRLGVKQVVNLATLISQRASFRLQVDQLLPFVGALWRHSVASAAGCQWLAERTGNRAIASNAFMAGMLHDIGKLVVLRVLDDGIHRQRGPNPSDAEILQVMTELHADCGGSLLEAWNLPLELVEVVRNHHGPEADDPAPLLTLVRLVDTGCARLGIGLEPPRDFALEGTPEAKRLGLSEADVTELEGKLEEAKSLADSV